MNTDFVPLTPRAIVEQALANLHARGIYPQAAVLALCERYAREELSHSELLDLLCSRTDALLAQLSASASTPPKKGL